MTCPQLLADLGTLVNAELIAGVAVDKTNVYFTDQRVVDGHAAGALWRIRKDGSESMPTALVNEPFPVRVALDERAIYWVVEGSGEVRKMVK
jgi:hypothetical protein